jgi:hypothetical protein
VFHDAARNFLEWESRAPGFCCISRMARRPFRMMKNAALFSSKQQNSFIAFHYLFDEEK